MFKSLTSEEIRLVQELWRDISLNGDIGSDAYNRLFYLKPECRQLFETDMGSQAELFARGVTLVIENIHDAEKTLELLTVIRDKHKKHLINASDYPIFYDAIIYVFESYLPDGIEPKALAAWSKFYWSLIQYL